MNIFENAQQTVADMPNIRERLTLRYIAIELFRTASLSLLYFVALKEAFSLGVHPLVSAWITSSLVYSLFSIWAEVSKKTYSKSFGYLGAAFVIALSVVFFVVNNPLWVKRTVSFIAIIEILFLLISFLFLKRIHAWYPNWNVGLFRKGQAFKGPKAVVILIVNETSIRAGDDWLWISSRVLSVLLTPFIFVLIAWIITKQRTEG